MKCLQHHHVIIFGIALTAVMLATLPSPPSVNAAGPWIMLVEGDLIPERIVLGDWEQIQVFYLASDGQTDEDLSGRPFLRLTIFWQPKWQGYVPEGKPLSLLQADMGDEHLRFYPSLGDRPAVITEDPPIPPGYTRAPAARIVGDAGIQVLQNNGVPVSIDQTSDPGTSLWDWRIVFGVGLACLSTVLAGRFIRRSRQS